MRIEHEIELELSAEAIWRRLILEDGFKRWLGADRLDIDLFKEETFAVQLTFQDELVQIVGETALLVPPHKFGLTWMEQIRGRDRWSTPTRVLLDLEEKGEHTRLTITHEGFHQIGADLEGKVMARYQAFWQDPDRTNCLRILLEDQADDSD